MSEPKDKSETGDIAKKTHKVDHKSVKVGDIHAFLYYARVTRVERGGEVLGVKNLYNGQDFNVSGSELIQESFSADYAKEVVTVTKTRAAELLVESYPRPFTVVYIKQGKKPGEEGEERTLRGRLVRPEPLLGRSHVEDFDITDGARLRLVDHRTIKSITLDGVMHKVKDR